MAWLVCDVILSIHNSFYLNLFSIGNTDLVTKDYLCEVVYSAAFDTNYKILGPNFWDKKKKMKKSRGEPPTWRHNQFCQILNQLSKLHQKNACRKESEKWCNFDTPSGSLTRKLTNFSLSPGRGTWQVYEQVPRCFTVDAVIGT